MTREDTVHLVPMDPDEISAWEWIARLYEGTPPMSGFWVRDHKENTLGALLLIGYMSGPIHAEKWDPILEDFFFAGITHRVLSQGVHRVLEAHPQNS